MFLSILYTNANSLGKKQAITKACLIRSARPDLLFEVCTEEMMRLINIDAELWKTAELLETLVVHQRGVIPCIVLVIISAVDC